MFHRPLKTLTLTLSSGLSFWPVNDQISEKHLHIVSDQQLTLITFHNDGNVSFILTKQFVLARLMCDFIWPMGLQVSKALVNW